MDTKDSILGAVIGAIIVALAIIGIACIVTLPIMFLWNWVMPDIFGLTTINFKQALCLALLSKCLFGWKVKMTDKKK